MITVVGSINMDLVVQTNHVPEIGETKLGTSFSTYFGGKGANQVVSIARLGKEAQMIGACGTDGYGEKALALLKQENVKTENVFLFPNETTGIATIIVSEADNRIIVVPGANNLLTCNEIERVKQEIVQSEIVVIQLEIPSETVHAVLEICKQHDVPVVLNPAPVDNFKEEFIELATYLTPNESECISIFGGNMEQSLELYPNKLIVTLGDQGARYYDGEKHIFIKGFQTTPLDTTGAGDTFNGSFAFALAEGMGIQEAVRFANASASISVEKQGAQSGMPSLEKVLDRLKDKDSTDTKI
ncbi:ribokinase [Oceanobacillus polygoni]|uniref:Ribokinase n=1 Tax=Oceanobacillus polygoni TaxID=1235259 RepID=A0A9X0YMN2_9BACI|nr:ribokinase [Oceanobacillus polygoni]MBP2075818.1 ribokinase [Oceanobacillus polygoni]